MGNLGFGTGREDYPHPRSGPQVMVLPPVLFGIAWVVGFLLDWLTGATLGNVFAALLSFFGPVLVIGGLIVGAGAILQFRLEGTTVEPTKPANALVTGGLYRFTRNPMYLALIMVGMGLSFMVDAPLMLIATGIAVIILRWGVIAEEETYLAREFGEKYLRYTGETGRWVGRRDGEPDVKMPPPEPPDDAGGADKTGAQRPGSDARGPAPAERAEADATGAE
ncbi:MAG: methyltransferase family protein [Alphaproteobacteria bacterium]